MSQTYRLVCKETNTHVWVGQGHDENGRMGNFYSGEPETMKTLGEFLRHTQGKPLVLMTSDEDQPSTAFRV